MGDPTYVPEYKDYYRYWYDEDYYIPPSVALIGSRAKSRLASIANKVAPVAHAAALAGLTYSVLSHARAEDARSAQKAKDRLAALERKEQLYRLKSEKILQQAEYYNRLNQERDIVPYHTAPVRVSPQGRIIIESPERELGQIAIESPERGRSPRVSPERRHGLILPPDMPTFDFELPIRLHKRAFSGPEITRLEESSDAVWQAIKRAGYNAAMSDPIVQNLSTYKMFTPKGMRKAVLNGETYVPEIIRKLGPDGLEDLYANYRRLDLKFPYTPEWNVSNRDARAALMNVRRRDDIFNDIKLRHPNLHDDEVNKFTDEKYKKIYGSGITRGYKNVRASIHL